MTNEIPSPEPVELLDGVRVGFDRGLTNGQVFGTYAELASRLADKFGLRCGVQCDSGIRDLEALRKIEMDGLITLDRAAEQCAPADATQGGEAPVTRFELVVPDFDDLLPVGVHASGAAEAAHRLLAMAVPGAALPPPDQLDVQVTAVGGSTMARVAFHAAVRRSDLYDGLAQLRVPVSLVRPGRTEATDGSFQPGSINFQPGSINFQPGSINFQPGVLRFEPGSINFQPGSINFQPGSINFQPRKLLPQPVAGPPPVLDAFLRLRWEAAMCCPTGGRSVTVAVLDTGIDETAQRTHPLFAHNHAADRWGGSPDHEVRPDRRIVDDVYGHGTHVAGLVALRAPFARINHESVRADGTSETDAFQLARDLGDVADADIVVFSLATAAPSEHDVPALRQVVGHLLARGAVVVAAAGTDVDLEVAGDRLFPADFRFDDLPGRLISVGAVDANREPMVASRSCPPGGTHVVSYGVGVVSAFPSGTIQWGEDGPIVPYDGWARWTGTSMAAPRVAGAIAHRYQTRPDVDSVVQAADLVVDDARKLGGLVQ